MFDFAPTVAHLAQANHPSLLDLAKDEHRKKVVAVHIRRQDFLHEPDTHGILDGNYFKGAVQRAQMMVPGSKHIVFSDDPDWCERQAFL